MGTLGDLSPEGSIAVGVIVSVISTAVQSLGLTLQRKSHMLEDERDNSDGQRPPYRRRRWQLGMFMFIISNVVGSTIQITTLPLPVLSTLQASGLVFNTLFATLILGEPFTRYSFFGTILVCAGAILIAIFGAISDPAHNLTELILLLKRWPFILWMALTVFLVALTFVASRVLKVIFSPAWTRPSTKSPRPASPSRVARVRLVRGLMFGFMSGVLSAHSLLMAKSAVELIVRTIVDRENQFNRWQSWLILFALIFFALSQLYYMHRGLKLCSTSVLYPFVFCIYNIVAILDGLIYFHQTSRLNPLRAGLIAVGTVILLSGVLALSWRLDDSDAPAALSAPLTPGMGTVEGDGAPFKPLTDEEAQYFERTPLLSGGRRHSLSRRRTTVAAPDPTTELAQIWAELDDSPEDDLSTELVQSPLEGHTDEDTLASLPHSPPNFPRAFLNRQNQPGRRSSSGGSSSKLPYHSSSRAWGHRSTGSLNSPSRNRSSNDDPNHNSSSNRRSSASPNKASTSNGSLESRSPRSPKHARLNMKKNRRRKSAPLPLGSHEIGQLQAAGQRQGHGYGAIGNGGTGHENRQETPDRGISLLSNPRSLVTRSWNWASNVGGNAVSSLFRRRNTNSDETSASRD